MIIVRWFGYVLHALAYALYSAVQFISKPGTRFVVPILFMAFSAFYIRPVLHDHFHVPLDFGNVFSVVFDAVTFIVLFILCWGYVYLSRSIGLLLGIFPPVARPLRPLGSLQATTDDVRPVVVRLAVPPLRQHAAAIPAAKEADALARQSTRPSRLLWLAIAVAVVGGCGGAGWYALVFQPAQQAREREEQARAEIIAKEYDYAKSIISSGTTLNDERITCQLHGESQTLDATSQGAVADNIVSLAQAPKVVFLITPLQFEEKDGWAQPETMKKIFADTEASFIDANGPYSPIVICYVRWPSLDGFGSNTAYVEQSMAAFVNLWNIQNNGATFDGSDHRLIVLGYSAGGNLAAQSTLDLLSDEISHGLSHPPLVLVTVATPHEGANMAAIATGPGGLFSQLVRLASDMTNTARDGTDASSRFDQVTDSVGIQQLLPNSSLLLDLKNRLRSAHDSSHELRILNIYSSRDDVVPASSGTLDFADSNVDMMDLGATHTQFMTTPAGGRLRTVLASALTLERSANAPAAAAPPAPADASADAPASGNDASAPAAADTAPPQATDAQAQPDAPQPQQQPEPDQQAYSPVGAPFTRIGAHGETLIFQAQSDGTFQLLSINGVPNGSYMTSDLKIIPGR